MKITARSSLSEVAGTIADALAAAGIRAVLTGGACAALHTAGAYQSEDLDFVLQSAPSQRELDEALRKAGFHRRRDRYFHSRTRFFIEFPPGPLGIGRDLSVKPVSLRDSRRRSIRALSATDSCRDRLAAFYHWNDRPSLEAAVQIALRNAVDLRKIRLWSTREGASEGFRQFSRQLALGRGRNRPMRKS